MNLFKSIIIDISIRSRFPNRADFQSIIIDIFQNPRCQKWEVFIRSYSRLWFRLSNVFLSQKYLTESTVSFRCENRDIKQCVALRRKGTLFSSNFNKNRKAWSKFSTSQIRNFTTIHLIGVAVYMRMKKYGM
jgi:hypothetical protein